MKIVGINFFCLTALACLKMLRTEAIVSTKAEEKKDERKGDSQVSQTTNREYAEAYDESYDSGHLGLSAHALYGLPENYDGYEGHLDGKHHGYHHHHHHIEEPYLLHHHHLHHIKHEGDHHDEHHSDHHDHLNHHHNHDNVAYHKALAIKGLLVPLAGVALLGAAAAFVSNPILLQLGVISGAPLGRRRRAVRLKSSIVEMTPTADTDTPLNEIKLLETFLSQIPKNMVEAHERRMLANYFTCSNMAVNIHCLERLVCELHSPQSVTMPLEANVLSIIVNKVITNDYVPFDIKLKITRAIEEGRKSRCDAYKCETLEGYKSLRRLQ